LENTNGLINDFEFLIFHLTLRYIFACAKTLRASGSEQEKIMTQQLITKEEIEKIARLSHIELHETEIASTIQHVSAVLSYAARVQEIAKDVNIPSLKNSNVEREDIAMPCDAQAILAQAPEREGDFFVVPVIIEGQ
jgi:aspartyl-tRNA(Asn)/glutamyl-tRNA(Gln) amidotransferase subunit C